jgi:hypothetical protein
MRLPRPVPTPGYFLLFALDSSPHKKAFCFPSLPLMMNSRLDFTGSHRMASRRGAVNHGRRSSTLTYQHRAFDKAITHLQKYTSKMVPLFICNSSPIATSSHSLSPRYIPSISRFAKALPPTRASPCSPSPTDALYPMPSTSNSHRRPTRQLRPARHSPKMERHTQPRRHSQHILPSASAAVMVCDGCRRHA